MMANVRRRAALSAGDSDMRCIRVRAGREKQYGPALRTLSDRRSRAREPLDRTGVGGIWLAGPARWGSQRTGQCLARGGGGVGLARGVGGGVHRRVRRGV